MSSRLTGKTVAILAADGFEEVELTRPRQALEDEGAITVLVSPAHGKVKGWHHDRWGEELPVDKPLADANADDYDALLLPGGVMNPDKLRTIPEAVEFVRAFADAGKPIASICHGAWSLVEADVVDGRLLTSWPSLQTDIVNAGGSWVDEQVVVDENFVTSRKPDDIPAFNKKMIDTFANVAEVVAKQLSAVGV